MEEVLLLLLLLLLLRHGIFKGLLQWQGRGLKLLLVLQWRLR